MDNVFTDKQKRCIEWAVKTSSVLGCTIVSQTFLLQDRICKLKFYTGDGDSYPYLSFECNDEPQLPIATVLRVVFHNENSLNPLFISITGSNQRIWDCTWRYELRNSQLKFELIFFDAGCSNEDKSVQTPSYIDSYFLMDVVSQDFSKLLNESPCHDVEFICGDESIKAHKSILSCRSDVFASMLQSNMLEGKTGRVNIQDMDADIFRLFLRYLYTGVLPPLTVDFALQFYEAADKYNISSLKKQCADFLVDNFSSEYAYDTLILADQHNDQELKKNVIDFMVEKQMPYAGEKWTDFCKQNPILATEVLNLFCQHLRPK